VFEDGKRDRRERRRQGRAGLRRGSCDLGRGKMEPLHRAGAISDTSSVTERSIYLGRSFFGLRSLADLNVLLRFFFTLRNIPSVE
jgi:hypothetical protein